MTKFKKALTIVLAFVMVLTLAPIQVNAAKKVKLNKSKLSLYVGKSYTLKLKNTKKKIKWSSSKKKVATVSKKGKVKAKKKGTCKIIAKVRRKKYVCKVTVKKKAIRSTSIPDIKPTSTPSAKPTPTITPVPCTPSPRATKNPIPTAEPTPTTAPTITPSPEPTKEPTLVEKNISNLKTILDKNGRIIYNYTTEAGLMGCSGIESSFSRIEFFTSCNGTIGSTKYSREVYFYWSEPTITVYSDIIIGSKRQTGSAKIDLASYSGGDLNFSGEQPMKSNNAFLEGLEDWRSLLALKLNLSYGDIGFSSLSEITTNESEADDNYGLFDNEYHLKYSWSRLISWGLIKLEGTKITYVSKHLEGKLKIPNTITAIGRSAFLDCAEITEIEIPESVSEIGGYAFSNCYSLSKINIPENITTISPGIFSWCGSLVDFDIPANITSIGGDAFRGCGIKYAVIPDGVTVIPESAFSCSKIRKLILPISINKIESNAFSYIGLSDDPLQIYYKGTQNQWDEINIDDFGFYQADKRPIIYEYCE